ncbi:MAG TPA: tetrahydromethanopterin S-methyltransferase subunit D [Methanosarcinales archaeon]|nr:MAG: tetrahydromethanopterin S-methyltransferase subunit D [Methanosarcinales archaeon]HDJ37927.1 tetrahydromethanopterin S-methyltransferase subunit D [Methanosarcinales archaeon]
MTDIITMLATNWISIIGIIIGGICIAVGVHFVPVGGAPAAMAQATGIGTGTVQLAAGSGLTGLLAAGYMYMTLSAVDKPGISEIVLICATGAVGAMIMISVTMIVGNWVYIYGVGVPPASAKVDYDPLTGDSQAPYVAAGTVGQGMPTVCFVSGAIGGLLGGLGGSLVYCMLMWVNGDPAISSIFAIGVFLVNAVLPSYNIQGTIEGFHDPKFKRVPKAMLACFIASLLCGVIAVMIPGAGGF